jgi:hypothetical protein
MGTREYVYVAGPARRGYATGKWHKQKAVVAVGSGMPPHLNAVLEFEAGPGKPAREGDGWSVTGTLPMELAVVVINLNGRTPGEQERVQSLTGQVEATLVLDQDRTVRSMRLAGADFGPTTLLSDVTRQSMAAAEAEIELSDLGRRVEIAEPQADRVAET